MNREGAEVTSAGRAFQTRASATEKARRLTVASLTAGTHSSSEVEDRSLCRVGMSATDVNCKRDNLSAFLSAIGHSIRLDPIISTRCGILSRLFFFFKWQSVRYRFCLPGFCVDTDTEPVTLTLSFQTPTLKPKALVPCGE